MLCFLQDSECQLNGRVGGSDTEESEDELPELDLSTGNKDACVLEASNFCLILELTRWN